MAKYTCRFLNSANRIDDVATFECATDGLAQTLARRLFASSELPTLELWQRDRLICRDEKPT